MARLLSAAIILNVMIHILTYLKPNSALRYNLTNLQCEALDPRFLTYQLCELKAIRRGVASLNIEAKLHKKATSVVLNGGFYQKANGYEPFLLNSTFDFCNFQRTKKINLLGMILMSFISEFSNLNHTCPYENNVIIKDLIVTPDKVVIPIASGDYMLKLAFFLNGKLKTYVKVFFTKIE